jgi:POT family proton-dependent oligopeptide transporter
LLLSIALLSFGNCLGIPVLTVGIRRYTTETNRGFAFGLFYVIMNVAALISGPTVDFCTILYQNKYENNNDDDGANNRMLADGEVPEWSLTGYRLIVLIGILSNVVACLISVSVKEIKVTEPARNKRDDDDNDAEAHGTQAFQVSQSSAKDIFLETIRSPDFWRFLVVCMITLNIRMIFRHLDATLPKYMIREFGENVPKGTIYAINPALIIILVPFVTAATTKVDPLLMIHHGCYVSAISVFFLVFSTSIASCVSFVVVLSIGEAIWSPRLNDYTMQIAKEGREGTYMALASAPLFLAKLPVGMMSGYLLQKYCPEDGPRNSKLMWLIIGLTTATSPIILTACWGYVSKREGGNAETEQNSHYDEVSSNEMSPISHDGDGNAESFKDDPVRVHGY